MLYLYLYSFVLYFINILTFVLPAVFWYFTEPEAIYSKAQMVPIQMNCTRYRILHVSGKAHWKL